MRISKKENLAPFILWVLFVASTGLVLYYVVVNLTGNDGQPSLAEIFSNRPIFILSATVGLALILTHAWVSLGLLRGTFFVFLAFSLGLAAEVVGVKTGFIFGGKYIYTAGNTPVFMGIPLLVPIFWTAFVSTSCGLVNAFVAWLDRNKNHKNNSSTTHLLPTIVLDGLAVVAIDLILDPLQVAAGNWRWLTPGGFYDVPWGNFAGWFLVVVFITGIFRTVEHYFPVKRGVNPAAPLISAASYALLGIVLGAFALKRRMFGLSLIGLAVMLPLGLAGIYSSLRKAALQPPGTPAENQR